MSGKAVDYMDLVSRFDAEERASRGEQVVLPGTGRGAGCRLSGRVEALEREEDAIGE